MEMQYRRLGHSGLKVSVLSFGSWVTFGTQLVHRRAEECMSAAYESGVNFFDNAEAYAGGDAERIMGETIRRLGWPRHSYVISTKLYWGLHGTVNMQNTLNRKYLMQGIDGSLSRLGMDYVDILYCHRPDPETPVEETVWALSDIVSAGKALYWGTSEWPAEAIPRCVGHRRSPSSAQACGRAVELQLVLAKARRGGICPLSTMASD